jgi:hypothetical protein
MKKVILIVLSILTISISSCKSDDDSNDDPLTLSGTHWVRSDDDSRYFTFTSENEYEYGENNNSYPGTYIFDGSTGTFTETSSGYQSNFEVLGDILTDYQDPDDPTNGTNYIKQ